MAAVSSSGDFCGRVSPNNRQSSTDIDSYELATRFHRDYVSHRIPFTNDRKRGIRTGVRSERWRNVRVLGEGGFGLVRLQRKDQEGPNHVLASERAVKEIRLGSAIIDPRREIDAMVALSKDKSNFVQIEGWFRDQTTLFIAMEYFELGDLKKCVHEPLPEMEVRLIIAQVIEGLKYMHEASIVHRDLKPANIFVAALGPAWWVKIADFGISKRHSDFTELRTTLATGSEFAAPELMSLVEADITTFVDMWSVGCLMVWLVTHGSLFHNHAEMFRFAMGMINLPTQRLLDRNSSSDAIDFISTTLCLPPDTRLSAEDALKHPWLRTTFTDEDAHHSSTSSDHAGVESDVEPGQKSALFSKPPPENQGAGITHPATFKSPTMSETLSKVVTVIAPTTDEGEEHQKRLTEIEKLQAKRDQEETIREETSFTKSSIKEEPREIRIGEEAAAHEVELPQIERHADVDEHSDQATAEIERWRATEKAWEALREPYKSTIKFPPSPDRRRPENEGAFTLRSTEISTLGATNSGQPVKKKKKKKESSAIIESTHGNEVGHFSTKPAEQPASTSEVFTPPTSLATSPSRSRNALNNRLVSQKLRPEDLHDERMKTTRDKIPQTNADKSERVVQEECKQAESRGKAQIGGLTAKSQPPVPEFSTPRSFAYWKPQEHETRTQPPPQYEPKVARAVSHSSPTVSKDTSWALKAANTLYRDTELRKSSTSAIPQAQGTRSTGTNAVSDGRLVKPSSSDDGPRGPQVAERKGNTVPRDQTVKPKFWQRFSKTFKPEEPEANDIVPANAASRAAKASLEATGRSATEGPPRAIQSKRMFPDSSSMPEAGFPGQNRALASPPPPVSIEVQEKIRQDQLKASAIAMARKMYAIQQRHLDEAAGRSNDPESRSRVHSSTKTQNSDGVDDEPKSTIPDYGKLEEAARRLARERLAKIHDEHAEYRSYYSASPSSSRSGPSMRFQRRTSRFVDTDDEDDEEDARRIRSQMEVFQKKTAESGKEIHHQDIRRA